MNEYIQIIQSFGKENQITKAIEELGELIIALCKRNDSNIIEEIADVEIMIEQLKIIYDCSKKVNEIKDQKLKLALDIINKMMPY